MQLLNVLRLFFIQLVSSVNTLITNIYSAFTFTSTSVTVNLPSNLQGSVDILAPTTSGSFTLRVNGVQQIAQLKTTAARGLGQNYLTFYDPTGQKGYIGYGSSSTDQLSIVNTMNDAMGFYTNNTVRTMILAGGQIVFGGGSIAGSFSPKYQFLGAGSTFISVYDTTNSIEFLAGTNGATGVFLGAATNHPIQIRANNTNYLNITAAGVVTSWEGTVNVATAGLMSTATYETGSFTGTLTGCTTSPTTSVNWTRVGNMVTLNMASNLFATSNTTACTITGMPAALAPVRLQRICIPRVEDNTLTVPGLIDLPAASNVMALARTDNAALTASGTKGFGAFTVTYLLT